MILRGHHLLCMLGFRGLGYDENFVLNMDAIINKLISEQDMLIKVVDNVDNICDKCPNNVDGTCKNEYYPGSIKEMDNVVLKILGIEEGSELEYREILLKLKKSMNEEDMDKICENCKWQNLGYCKEGLKKLKESINLT